MSQLVIDIGPYIETNKQLRSAIEGLTEEQLKWKETRINGV